MYVVVKQNNKYVLIEPFTPNPKETDPIRAGSFFSCALRSSYSFLLTSLLLLTPHPRVLLGDSIYHLLLGRTGETGACRHEVADDDVLHETREVIFRSADGVRDENASGVLERSGREE